MQHEGGGGAFDGNFLFVSPVDGDIDKMAVMIPVPRCLRRVLGSQRYVLRTKGVLVRK